MIATFLVTVAVFVAGLALGRALAGERLRVLAALSAVRLGLIEPEPQRPAATSPRPGQRLRAAGRGVGRVLSLGPLRRFAVASLRGSGLPLRPEEFLALCAAGLLTGWLVGSLFALSGFLRLLAIVMGLLATPLTVRRTCQQRTARISLQMGDMLMTLGNGLRAGHSLLQALHGAAGQAAAPLGDELRRLLREIGAGIPVPEALTRMVERAANPDLELLVTAVLVQREVGGNLAEILDKISSTIRARVAVQNHLRVVTAQSRLSGWVVGLLPIGVFGLTTLVAPQVEGVLVHDPLGHIVAIGAVVLEVLGMLAIRRIVTIRY